MNIYWQVLLIGGSSGTGKTTLARKLSQISGAPALQMDDFRLVIDSILQQAQQRRGSDLDIWNRVGVQAIRESRELFTRLSDSPGEMQQALIKTAQVMSRAVEIVIAHHIATQTPVIIEGDGILPSLATRRPMANMSPDAGQLRAVFLVEEEEAALHTSALKRKRGFEDHLEEQQNKIIRANWLYGQWLKEEANQLSLPVLHSRPYETLVERILQIINVA